MTALPPRQAADPPSASGRPNGPSEPGPAAPARWGIIVGVAVVLAVLLAVVLLRDARTPSVPRTDAVDDVESNPDAAQPPDRRSGSFAPTDDPPPSLDGLVGDDFEQVVRTHEAYREWLFEHPDPQLADNLWHPDCSCYIQKRLLAHYQEHGRWWVGGDPIQVLSVEVLDDSAPNRVTLRAVIAGGGGKVIDATGTVHDTAQEGGPPSVQDRVYVRDGPESPWRLLDVVDQGPLPESDDA